MKHTEPYKVSIEELLTGVADAKAVFAKIGPDWAVLFHHDLQSEVRGALGRLAPLSLLQRWRLRRLYRESQRFLALIHGGRA